MKKFLHKLFGHFMFWKYSGPTYRGQGKHRHCIVCDKKEWNWDHDYWENGGWSTDMPPQRGSN